MSDRRTAFLERLPLLGDRPVLRYALAIAVSVGACIVRSALDAWFPPGFPFLTFFPAVIVSAFLLGRGPGTVAAGLCGLMAWYYFIPPFQSFAIVGSTAVALGFYAAVVTVDIALVHWMQHANQAVRLERERNQALATGSARLAARNELLFQELQHRVSNNIQMVGAVLSLHRRGLDDARARSALDDAAARIGLIGRIQRQLYDIDGKDIDLTAFIRALVDDLAAADGRTGVSYTLTVDPAVALAADARIPFALILAEAVANAMEHGFAGRETGTVTVDVGRTAREIVLSIADDGAGLPNGFDVAASTSLGLTIVRALARQLDGQFAVRAAPGGGTISSLTFVPAQIAAIADAG